MSTQKSKKTKASDRRPARSRYWYSGGLKARKIRNLVRSNGFATVAEATAYWLTVRTRFYGPGYRAAK